ncbi:recombinase family protein [Vibrio alginolyticus]|uniref:recombinase family protein n=1 Tax=Vibrio alginolyticus TaxID=663 RepID=UPI001BD1FB71|nr:recombinase family protein [Vibrio alginolyticus]MBT0074537.1 recombinase family protein [Vibrio alginolyticus]
MALIPYARVSSGKQLDGLSMSLQGDSKLLDKLAKEHNTTVSNLVYNDEGKSAYKGKNVDDGELGRLINDIKRNIIKQGDIIVMRALDRLSRQNLTDSENLYNSIVGSNVSILTTIDNHLYKRDCVMSSVLKTLAFKTANEESAKKSHLTNTYASHRIQQFLSNEKPDNGTAYDIGIGRHPFWIEIDNRVIQKGKHFALARVMFEKAMQGYGVARLQKFALEQGLELSHSAVGKMFRSHTVFGDLHINHQGKKYTLKSYYPALATESEYYKVRAIKDRLIKESNAQRKHVSILAGMQKLYCGCCNSSVGIARNTRQEINYYSCINKINKCYQPLRQDIIDNIVLNAIDIHIFNVDSTDTTVVDGLELEFSEKKKQHESAVERYMILGDSAGENAVNVIHQLKSELDDIQKKIETEKNQTASCAIDYDAITSFRDAMADYKAQQDKITEYVHGDSELKQEIKDVLKLILKRITIDHRHMITIEMLDGSISYLYLLRRKDGKRLHDRYYVPIKVHDKETVNIIRTSTPELVNWVTQSELDTLDIYLEDVTNPFLTIERNRHVRDLESEFFNLLQGNVYEWKRADIMKAGATASQWQGFKDADVLKYGFTKAECTITTRHYTKQHKTIIYRDLNKSELRNYFNCKRIEL